METLTKLPYREPECSLWELIPETIIAASSDASLGEFNPLEDYSLNSIIEPFNSLL